jgi:lipopolysaccharide export LptBFGC system permease protein LptF
MKKLHISSAFGKRWGTVIISSAMLILSVILLLLFPRREHLALSTVFAVMFWLSLAAVIVFTVLAVRNREKPPLGKAPEQNKTI